MNEGIEGRLLNQIIKNPIRLSGLIIVSEVNLSNIFPSIPVYSIDRQFRDGPSESRTCPSSISLAWWLSLDCSSSISTVDGYPLGQIRRLRHQANYANPLAKVSLFRLYQQLVDSLDKNRITYGDAKSRSTNDLREQFLEKHPLWIITDPTLFYSFTAQLWLGQTWFVFFFTDELQYFFVFVQPWHFQEERKKNRYLHTDKKKKKKRINEPLSWFDGNSFISSKELL